MSEPGLVVVDVAAADDATALVDRHSQRPRRRQ
ncbi:DUF6207 family protein [Streptomyces sp. NPDC004976]